MLCTWRDGNALDVRLGNVVDTEFGLYVGGEGDGDAVVVPADGDVKGALGEMAVVTWKEMSGLEEEGRPYEPGEKHGAKEYLYYSLERDEVRVFRLLRVAANLRVDGRALQRDTSFSCYFGRFEDGEGRRLLGLRRAAYFKGLLKSRNSLVRWMDNSLKLVKDSVFKLDNDFDLLIDGQYVHILRPAAFEILADMKEAVLAAVSDNMAALDGWLPFVGLTAVGEYAASHSRAARYLASICTGEHGVGVDRGKLVGLCKRTGVRVEERNGRVAVAAGSAMGFLEVLDRRRYGVDLVPDAPETYKASSRQRLGS